MVSNGHPGPAAAADGEPLQERRAFAGWSMTVIDAIGPSRLAQTFLDAFVVVPRDVGWVGIGQPDQPFVAWLDPCLRPSSRECLDAPAAVHVCAGVGSFVVVEATRPIGGDDAPPASDESRTWLKLAEQHTGRTAWRWASCPL